MDRQLLIKGLQRQGERVFGDTEVVTRVGDGYERCTSADLVRRVCPLVGALRGLRVGSGDRVLTPAWNSQRHLEAYSAVPGMGAVLHTGNQRLSPAQLAYTTNHARDGVVLVDPDLVPLLETIAIELTSVREVVVLGPVPEGAMLRDVHACEDLLAAADLVPELPEFGEDTPAGTC